MSVANQLTFYRDFMPKEESKPTLIKNITLIWNLYKLFIRGLSLLSKINQFYIPRYILYLFVLLVKVKNLESPTN